MKVDSVKRQTGITLISLVITIIIIIILATISINSLFGSNGLITKAQQATEMSNIERVREQLEMAKGTAIIDGKGYIEPDHYFDIIEQEGIIGSKETDVIPNEDGTYEVTTIEGYIFIITLLPTPEKVTDLEIEYSGKSEGPRIVKLIAEGTTNSISIKVDARNANNATYTYEYKINGSEEAWEKEESKSNACTLDDLIEGETYDIRVTVTTGEGTATRITSVHLGELPEGTITFEAEWVGDGTAKVTINTSAEGYRLQYQIDAVEENGWTDIKNGGTVEGLIYPSTVYARIFDGTNGSEHASESLEDKTAPTVTVEGTGTTSNSVTVSVQTSDSESGMIDSPTYTYSIKQTSEPDSSYTTPSGASSITANTYTFIGLMQGTSYDVKVEVNGDRAGNTGTGYLPNQTTGSITGGDEAVEEGAITFGNTTWSNNLASITVSTNTNYTIQYQVNGIEEGKWQPIANGGTIGNLSYPSMVYARLYDGTNYGQYASAGIEDKLLPQVDVTAGENTSNSVTVSVQAVDNESGMIESPTYTYSIKQTGKPESSYTTPSGASNLTANNYTFTGLTQGTSYDVKVEVNGDRAGNIGTGYLPNQTTGSITGGDEAIEKGAITFGNTTWSNNLASITVSTNTNYTIQYQVNGTEEDGWKPIANGGTIGNLSYPSMVYARLYDGTNYGQYASAGIIDNTNPQNAKITLSSTSVTTGSTVRATVTHRDSESGPEIKQCRYVWNTLSGKIGTDESSYTGGAFSSNGQQISRTMSTTGTWYLHVLTVDKAGNKWETVSSGITVRQLVTSVSVSPSSATINVGSTRQLTATISPSSASNKSVTWSSSNSSIASVSSSGLVTAKTAGTVTITATAKDGSGKKDTCSVTVNQLVTSVNVSPSSVTLKEGETEQLSATVSPQSASNKSVTWSSSNSNIASVSSSGLVTAVAEGTVTITATAKDGSGQKDTCSVTVEASTIEDVLEEGKWVRYPSAKGGNIDCVVLYDSSSSYGIEIIAMKSVEDVHLSIMQYNIVKEVLNDATSAYNNSTYSSRARCVGSIPNNPTLDSSGYFTSNYSYMEEYNGKFKNGDTHYMSDWNQMCTLGIQNIDCEYWLASRKVQSDSSSSDFNVYYVNMIGNLSISSLFYVFNSGISNEDNYSYGLRPVFKLKSGIKVTGGSGTESSPYTLGT